LERAAARSADAHEDLYALIRAAYEAGLNRRQIALHAHVARQTVYRLTSPPPEG
jgi:DNA-binding transcriptional regulator LsrR (DeoR family)